MFGLAAQKPHSNVSFISVPLKKTFRLTKARAFDPGKSLLLSVTLHRLSRFLCYGINYGGKKLWSKAPPHTSVAQW